MYIADTNAFCISWKLIHVIMESVVTYINKTTNVGHVQNTNGDISAVSTGLSVL